MLCRKIKQLFSSKQLTNIKHFDPLSRYKLEKCFWIHSFLTFMVKSDLSHTMSSAQRFRLLLRDLSAVRLWGVWSKTYLVNSVFKRCRRDRSVREVLQCFRQAFARPRRTLLFSATAAYKKVDENEEVDASCNNITDEELERLVSELEGVAALSKSTLYCQTCGKRIAIDKKQPGDRYCTCKTAQPLSQSEDGWEPFMEAEDVIIWRKEYKKGQGLYAYKVYGRYPEVRAEDFAAVQVDNEYRKKWDDAVAKLCVVRDGANGVSEQALLHWEVQWPRMFANRDYVYLRRHKNFDVKHKTPPVIPSPSNTNRESIERPNVHARAKRMAQDSERKTEDVWKDNKVFVIVSKSCVHKDVPETTHAVRVTEYWSHMVVRSIDGADKAGTEFVLTYYDEPALRGGVAAWATGRAAPAYLRRMRRAAAAYRAEENAPTSTVEICDIGKEETTSDDDAVSDKETNTADENSDSTNSKDQSTQTETDGGIKKTDSDDDTKTDVGTNTDGTDEKQTDVKNTEIVTSSENTNVEKKAESSGIGEKQSTPTNQNASNDRTEDKSDGKSKESTGESENKPDESKNKPDESKNKPDESKNKPDESENKPGESKNKPGESEKKTGESENKPNESENKTESKSGEEATDNNNNCGWWRYLYPFYYFL